MPAPNPYEYRKIGDRYRTERKFEIAGNYYSAAGSGALLQVRYGTGKLEQGKSESRFRMNPFGKACHDKILAAISYRVGDEIDRAESVCRRGDLLTNDVVSNESSVAGTPAKEGLCWELIGDFRLLRGAEHSDAYDRAKTEYDSVENHHGWQAETEFYTLISPVSGLAEKIGIEISDEVVSRAQFVDLGERIEFKRKYFPKVVEELSDEAFATYDH